MRITLTVLLYAIFSHSYLLHDVPTVVYTCSDGATYVAPRAMNARWDTVFETVHSEHSEKPESYFCKVSAALDMVKKHPGKRVVYVDSDAVVDLQAVIDDVGCSRMSLFMHPGPYSIVQTAFFCFTADEGSAAILETWWSIRKQYPKKPGGLKDQAAMNDLIKGADRNVTVDVLVTDPLGIEIGHCSHAVGAERDLCKRNLDVFVHWDRACMLLIYLLKLGLWLLPLCMVCGVPLIMPGVFGGVLDVNPLTILAVLSLPPVLSQFLVRNNRHSGSLPVIHTRMFSGMIILNLGGYRPIWVPSVGLRLPRNPADTFWALGCLLFVCCLLIFRQRIDRWTWLTCPTLYHWLVWSKAASDRCSSLSGSGRWLSVVATGPNLYHLSCGSHTKGEVGVPVSRVYGWPHGYRRGCDAWPCMVRDLDESCMHSMELRGRCDTILGGHACQELAENILPKQHLHESVRDCFHAPDLGYCVYLGFLHSVHVHTFANELWKAWYRFQETAFHEKRVCRRCGTK